MLRRVTRWVVGALGVGGLLGWGPAVSAALVLQWDFDQQDLTPSRGEADLEYITTTEGVTEFDTTTSFGIPNIGGLEGQVMLIATTNLFQGLRLPVPAMTGNGGGELFNDWTISMDVYFRESSSGRKRSLLELSDLFLDSEFGVDKNNALYHQWTGDGQVLAGEWHRIAFVVDSSEKAEVRKFVDGLYVGGQSIDPADIPDGRFAVDPNSALFTDDSLPASETAEVFVSSIQFRDEVLSDEAVHAMGRPTADGLPLDIGGSGSFISRWLPANGFWVSGQNVGVILREGDSRVDPGSIVLRLDGNLLAAERQTIDGEINVTAIPSLAPEQIGNRHVLEVMFTDDAGSEVSGSHTFQSAWYLEDFEGAMLGAAVDAALAGQVVWTRDDGPEGWQIDVSVLPNLENTELVDGITEWTGWSFARKSWWIEAAGGEGRTGYLLGRGTVAVVDAAGRVAEDGSVGQINTTLTSPPIPVDVLMGQSVLLEFESSWQPGDQQAAVVSVSFDEAEFQEILRVESDPESRVFRGQAHGDTFRVPLSVPMGAAAMVVQFGLEEGEDEGWWAIDLLRIIPVPQASGEPGIRTIRPNNDESVTITYEGTLALSAAVDGEFLPIPGARSPFTIPKSVVEESPMFFLAR